MTLTEFLLARIAEDEVQGRAAAADWPTYDYNGVGDPDRVLAECEAKRRIVEMQAANDEDRYLPGFHYKAQMIERVLRTLTLPYADHPDYRAEWKP